MTPDRLISALDTALRTLLAPARSARPDPADTLQHVSLDEAQRRLSTRLMRVNHSGEICAQALYQGQILVAREPRVRGLLRRAAYEEDDHLAWTEQRLKQLGGRKSLLNPLWYAGSFVFGAAAGALGDRWNLGFLAETERQVEQHLSRHLDRLPVEDDASRAIVEQMRRDEAGHAVNARRHGARELPAPVRLGMKLTSRIMTGASHWL